AKEVKVPEYRVGLTPASVAELVAHGHELFVETKAGNGIDCPDKAYEKAGATILPAAPSVLKSSHMLEKVKAPPAQEHRRPGAAPHPPPLPPPRGRQAAGRGADEVGRDLHRL